MNTVVIAEIDELRLLVGRRYKSYPVEVFVEKRYYNKPHLYAIHLSPFSVVPGGDPRVPVRALLNARDLKCVEAFLTPDRIAMVEDAMQNYAR